MEKMFLRILPAHIKIGYKNPSRPMGLAVGIVCTACSFKEPSF